MARIDYYGGDEIVRKLDKLGVDVERALEESLKASAEKPKEEMLSYMQKHRRRGITEESFTEKIETDRDKGTIYLEIGFDIYKGGLPALFLNYGTPFIEPSFFIDKAIENNLDVIKKTQEETLNKLAREVGL